MPWNPLEQPIDYALVAGQRTPGFCTITAATRPRQWDERRGYGVSGASLVFRGTKLGTFTMRLDLYDEKHWEKWEEFRPILEPISAADSLRAERAQRSVFRSPSPRAHGLDIVHPILEYVGIRAAVVTSLKAPEQDESGVWTVVIEWTEFRPPVVTTARVDGTKDSIHREPQTEQERIIEGQIGRIHELEGDRIRIELAQARR